ncbi:MAG TPA: hypothetical protein VGG57_08970 [Stellaceae bacterium]|jgi:hypothetical protein
MPGVLKHLSKLDIPGGGQVVAEGDHAYIGHMGPPDGTSIVDVSDPRKPKLVSTIKLPGHTHSHKVRVHGDIMLVNNELYRAAGGERPADFEGGIKVYDTKDKANPRQIGHYKSGGSHRFDSDGRHAYISSEEDGYIGDIVVILDLADPTKPEKIGQWHMPGQHAAGGETPTWRGRAHRCHHPLRRGDRLYTSYWHGGFVILDCEDLRHPKFISGLDWSPPYPCPTHTVLPIPHELHGRKVAVVTDEEVADRLTPSPNAFMWIVDITDEKHPVPISTWAVPHDEPFNRECWYGAHQPQETVNGNIILVTWFGGGLRAVDISNPYRPEEIDSFMPTPGAGQKIVQSNDIFVDKTRGLAFLIDRLNGLDIFELNT